MLLMYIGQKLPLTPLTDHTPTKLTRNQEIREQYAKGETIVGLAAAFEISEQRVSQVLRGRRK
jgi:Mor family transcriptional regulator